MAALRTIAVAEGVRGANDRLTYGMIGTGSRGGSILPVLSMGQRGNDGFARSGRA